jgi:hypothetical protein
MPFTFGKLKVKRAFEKVVNPEAAEALADGGAKRAPLTESSIEIVLVFVRGETPEELSRLIGCVGEIAAAHEAFVYSLCGSLVSATFGAHPNSHPGPSARADLARDLLRELGTNIKVVHGAGRGCYGLFGASKNLFYGFDFPKFDSALGLVGRAEFGTIQEFKP